MKIRTGFVSNSSSSSFIITNSTDKKQTLVKFVKENKNLINDFNKYYNHNYKLEDVIESAKSLDIKFLPNESKEISFGDEDGTLIGRIYDYILRDGGASKSFNWHFSESLR